LPQHALARRALPQKASAKHSWVRHGAAALGVSVLGLGVAGSVAMTGNAEHLPVTSVQPAAAAAGQPSVSASVAAGVKVPTAFNRREAAVSRSSFRPALGVAAVDRRADQRAQSLAATERQTSRSAQRKALQTREKSLAAAASSAKKKAKEIKAAKEERQAKEKKRKAEEAKRAKRHAEAKRQSHRASLPVTSGYRIAARFGDTGSWARYHTGIDFAAPVGTTIHAADSGTITHAGSGSQGWAGHYVTIRHADGKSTLYAHMSAVSVRVGERVDGGDRVGAIGMTGRTFGPHVHFELYPAGVTPRNPYDAINPAPWLRARGLNI
jgi:murein DD-endopeptidase MepM/ murein hydrolase activator NlpD